MSQQQSASGVRARQPVQDKIQPLVAVDVAADDPENEGEKLIISLAKEDPTQGGPATAAGKKFRLRGVCLWHIGSLYPEANVLVHRMNDVPGTDYEVKGHVLYWMRSSIDEAATFRVHISKCDVPKETALFWIREEMAGKAYTAEDFHHILKLSPDWESVKMMMITVYKEGTHAWGVVLQVPGKQYSLDECLGLLQVPGRRRGDFQGFGGKRWGLITPIPDLWVGKDLTFGNVANKIVRVMDA